MSAHSRKTVRNNQTYARQAITTTYHGATNTIRASADAGSLTVTWNDALDVFPNHRAAALAFAKKYGWTGKLVGGGTKNGYVFVIED